MSRRVQKKVYDWQTDHWSLNTEHGFVYDGWNLIKEQTTAGGNTTTDDYVWGLDLSGSLQGAGGIGGLLSKTNSLTSKTFLYTFDANGNVGQLVDASDSSLAAHYEYDPFGNLLVATGPEATNNPFRFSTKYYDAEVGLYYYGRRYYSPELGRWVNRNPIQEGGGVNLYKFTANNSINFVDALGEKILSMEVRGIGESWIENVLLPGVWRRSLEAIYRDVGAGKRLGLHVGKGYDPTALLYLFHEKGKPMAVGLWKFETKAMWCDSGELPVWRFYRSHVKLTQTDKETGETKILFDEPGECPDGPTGHAVSTMMEELANPDGTFTAYAWDAPRYADNFHENTKYRYELTGEWRFTIKDTVSEWEAKIRLGFSFDDDANPGTAEGYFEILSPPTRVKETAK